jgi:hypothetical protein
MCLGAIWAIAAFALQVTRGRGVAAHAVIAVVLFGIGVAARFRDLPWELISLGIAVAALVVASRRPMERVHNVLAGLVALFGAIHILMSLGGPDNDTVWIGTLVERLVGASLIIFAGIVCRRIRQSLDTLLLAIGICWGTIAIGLELIRHDLATAGLVFHGLTLAVAVSLWIPTRRLRLADRLTGLVTAAVVATGIWASVDAATPIACVLLFVAPLALIGMAIRPVNPECDSDGERSFAAVMAAAVAGVWGFNIASHLVYAIGYFPLACAAGAGVLAVATGRLMPGARGAWVNMTADAFGIGFATLLLYSSALIISRDASAVVLEVLCLAGLAYTLYIRRAEGKPIDFSTAAFIVAFGLVVQANLMRLVGPPGDQNVLGILDLRFPAVTSLLWATAGSALTIWSRKVTSRALWVSGAVLLVASAVKLVLFDFGSLGQLANILAVIAAGGMFLLVGWLAPMPPAAPEDDKPANGSPPDDPAPEPSGWTRTATEAQMQTPASAPSAQARAAAEAPQTQAPAHTASLNPTVAAGPEVRSKSARSETPTPAATGPARTTHADVAASGAHAAAASTPDHTLDQPHAQHGLFEYAEAQSRRTARGDVHVSSSTSGKRSMTDEEIDTSNRRTAWTIAIIVAVLVLLASSGARHALGLLHVIS